jgi:hypothetical protein
MTSSVVPPTAASTAPAMNITPSKIHQRVMTPSV